METCYLLKPCGMLLSNTDFSSPPHFEQKASHLIKADSSPIPGTLAAPSGVQTYTDTDTTYH